MGSRTGKRVGGGSKPVLLVTHGSFNPVHAGHVQMMVRAREGLEALGRRVVGGEMAITNQQHIEGKGSAAMGDEMRLALLRLALQPHSTWLTAADGTQQHSAGCVIADHQARYDAAHGEAVEAWSVEGSDIVIRYPPKRSGAARVVVAREGDEAAAATALHRAGYVMGRDALLLGATAEAGCISSTAARRALAHADADALRRCCGDAVAARLLALPAAQVYASRPAGGEAGWGFDTHGGAVDGQVGAADEGGAAGGGGGGAGDAGGDGGGADGDEGGGDDGALMEFIDSFVAAVEGEGEGGAGSDAGGAAGGAGGEAGGEGGEAGGEGGEAGQGQAGTVVAVVTGSPLPIPSHTVEMARCNRDFTGQWNGPWDACEVVEERGDRCYMRITEVGPLAGSFVSDWPRHLIRIRPEPDAEVAGPAAGLSVPVPLPAPLPTRMGTAAMLKALGGQAGLGRFALPDPENQRCVMRLRLLEAYHTAAGGDKYAAAGLPDVVREGGPAAGSGGGAEGGPKDPKLTKVQK